MDMRDDKRTWSLMSQSLAVQSLLTETKMRSFGIGVTASTYDMCPFMKIFLPQNAIFHGHGPTRLVSVHARTVRFKSC